MLPIFSIFFQKRLKEARDGKDWKKKIRPEILSSSAWFNCRLSEILAEEITSRRVDDSIEAAGTGKWEMGRRKEKKGEEERQRGEGK